MQNNKPSLRLITGGVQSTSIEAASSTPSHYGTVRQLLRRVLMANLTPDLTVEDACHLQVYADDEAPRMEQYLEDIKTLRSAGLDARVQFGDVPEGIVIADPDVFMDRFPELASVVPVMLAHDGVQPYTDGLPRRQLRLADV
jgi:hypothetical protein